MSVIAKLMLRQVVEYGTGSFAELGCVCDNDLMAAYATSEEDKLFSRYSPYGEMRINQRPNWSVFSKPEEHVDVPRGPPAFYVMLLTTEEAGDRPTTGFKGADAFVKVNCYSKTKFAGDGHRVELREVRQEEPDPNRRTTYELRRGEVIQKLSWKMHVDNPPAEAGFVAGQDYWAVFYPAEKFDRDTAIAAALGHRDAN